MGKPALRWVAKSRVMESVPLDQASELREAMRLFRATATAPARATTAGLQCEIPMARPASTLGRTAPMPHADPRAADASAIAAGACSSSPPSTHEASRSQGHSIIAVVSGKGGVGKTHLAVNLSLLLGKRGIGVLLLDVDAGAANADVLLRMDPHPTLADYLGGRCSRRQLVRPIGDRVRFVPGYSGPASLRETYLREPGEVRRMVEELRADERVVILDCGAGVGPTVLGPATAADVSLIVTTPEPTAMADAYALIKVMNRLESYADRPMLVVNQAHSADEAQHVFERMAATARRFLSVEVTPAGFVRSDRCVARSVMERRPWFAAFPGCRAARDLADVAERLCQHARVATTHRSSRH